MPWFAICLSVSPALLVYANNFTRIELANVVWVASTFAVCLVGLVLLTRMIANKKEATDPFLGCLFIGIFLGVYFAFNYQYVWMALWTIAGLAALFKPTLRETLARLVTITSIMAVAFGIATLASNISAFGERADLTHALDNKFAGIPAAAGKEQAQRDIYYIVLDRYARADQLKNVYGYDNSEFLAELRKRGFKVADQSYSNYHRTAHSLSSSLNMDYLDGVTSDDNRSQNDWLPIYRKIIDSRVGRFLKSEGFKFHFFGSWWEPTRQNALADLEFNYRAWPALGRVVLENSMLGYAATTLELRSLNQRQIQCQRAKLKFAKLQETAKSPASETPKFVFAHFLVPHPPFVIDKNGNCLSAQTVKQRSRAQNYIAQVEYANGKILKFLDTIQNAKGPKPIIVLQADEGPWPQRYARDEIYRLGADVSYVEWLKATPQELREKMGILNALYLPNFDTAQVAADTTPVNTFRMIMRHYFGADLPNLPDKSFVYSNAKDIYRFHDVTEKLRRP